MGKATISTGERRISAISEMSMPMASLRDKPVGFTKPSFSNKTVRHFQFLTCTLESPFIFQLWELRLSISEISQHEPMVLGHTPDPKRVWEIMKTQAARLGFEQFDQWHHLQTLYRSLAPKVFSISVKGSLVFVVLKNSLFQRFFCFWGGWCCLEARKSMVRKNVPFCQIQASKSWKLSLYSMGCPPTCFFSWFLW